MNGEEVLDDIEFENQIEAIKNNRELIKFTARQSYEARKDISEVAKLANNNRRSLMNLKITVYSLIGILCGLGILEWRDVIHIIGG